MTVTDLVIALSIGAVVATLVVARRVKSSALERWFLLSSALAQLGLLVSGWGGFGNVHGDFLLLLLILMIGLVTSLVELFVTLALPSWWRFLHLAGVVAFSILLVAVGDRYGR